MLQLLQTWSSPLSNAVNHSAAAIAMSPGDVPDDAAGDRVGVDGELARRRRRLQSHVLLQGLRTVPVQLRARLHQHRQVSRRSDAKQG